MRIYIDRQDKLLYIEAVTEWTVSQTENFMTMKVSEVLKRLKEDGWYLARHSGTSHKQFKHPTKKGKVTVAGKPSKDLPTPTLRDIFRQAKWEWPPE